MRQADGISVDSGDLAPRGASSFAATEALLAKQVGQLRDQFVEQAERLARTEEQVAFYYEKAAERDPSKADRYWRTAQNARDNARWARHIAQHFADVL
jgi:hypothetical protein